MQVQHVKTYGETQDMIQIQDEYLFEILQAVNKEAITKLYCKVNLMT